MLRNIAVALSSLLACSVAVAQPITYQGRLTDGSQIADGVFDFRFRLFDQAQGGSRVGSEVSVSAVDVESGLFTLLLDFQDAFGEQPLFLEVDVRQGGDPFTTLDGRQAITPAPVANYALRGSMSGISGGAIELNGGAVGVGETNPITNLHVQDTDIGLRVSDLFQDAVVIEDIDAYLGIYSDTSGRFGSGIQLGEIDGLGITDKWHLIRTTSAEGSELRWYYGVGDSVLTGSPISRLFPEGLFQLSLGSDASPTGGGTLMIGTSGSRNVLLDNNEIMAVNNGAPADLFFNNDGGNVHIGDATTTTRLPGELLVEGGIRTPARAHHRVYTAAAAQTSSDSGVRFSVSVVNGGTSRAFHANALGRSGFMWIPLDLPNGATITAVSALVRDIQVDADITVRLVREGFGLNASVVLDEASTSGAPGNTLLEFVTNETLDLENFSYTLVFSLSTGFLNGSEQRFYNADVLYTTDSIE